MLYVQDLQSNRRNNIKEYERLRSSADQNFLLCSNQYTEKLSQSSIHTSTPNVNQEGTSTLVLLTRIQSLLSLNNNNNSDLSVLNTISLSMQQAGLLYAIDALPTDTLGVEGQRVRPQADSFWSYYPGDVGIFYKKTSSWKPQNSRITRENKDYMTALAKGITRDDRQQVAYETKDGSSSRWQHPSSNNLSRPATGKSGTIGRPPTSTSDRSRMSLTNFSETTSRPTTAPVTIDKLSRRLHTGKVRTVIAARPPPPAPPPPPPPPPPPSVPFRVPRLIEPSGSSNNSMIHSFADGFKSPIYKSDSNFVHQLCFDKKDNVIDQPSSRETSNHVPTKETTNTRGEELIENDQDENKTNNLEQVTNLDLCQPDSNSENIEIVDDLLGLESPREDVEETDQRTTEQREEEEEGDEDILQRENDMDEYLFELATDTSLSVYDYKSPFTEEYDQILSNQSQFQTNNGNNDSNLRDLYRDNKIKSERDPNIKAVFEKCIKLARLQANTIKWEQRRRQNLMTYNRLLKNSTLETSTTNIVGNYSSKNNNNNNDMRDINDLKRDLRCNECKRVTCLGNCAPGQNYHFYKRIVSSISNQTFSSRQSSISNGLNNRCKSGYTTYPINSSRNSTDLTNTYTSVTTLNTNTNANNRIRSSRTTFSMGQKTQRSTADLRPRSVRNVTRDVKMKYEQSNLSPVVVVPLFEDESRPKQKSTNGLLPGKSFRSQRRDSLTMITQ
ncbi:unnamed protein product [Adineta steineri]|uniref:Uncharacterized protein n=1 Tax=Adineta steineri TaxID=433720 RepID=A0A815GXG6_9BILA|nr:unnamed protein product [Adineta steineri]CAF3525634.1 unnamed protein product [Adineta steineri]